MKKYTRLRDLREDADLTQAQVGALLNISQRAYSHFESGTRSIPVEILVGLGLETEADTVQKQIFYK